ncbi:MAG TPA: efflux RND transporter permease subunit [Verrucomicrobiae bacterium]|nr:efflux RND transporter permease subunit [Verrucomicrobiae bacterium]
MTQAGHQFGLAARVVRFFIDSKLTPLFVIASVLLGGAAVALLPREEEPQIIVPMIDIFVQAPGMSAKEVEERVTRPMEQLLWEIPGVEYIYSTSSPGMSMVIVRFLVGENEEQAIVRLNQKMYANFDRIPPGVSQPLIKPRRIDDVPVLALTLWSKRYDHYDLRRIAAQLNEEIAQVKNVSVTTLIGGYRRQVRVLLDSAKLTAYHLDPLRVTRMLQSANQELKEGSFAADNREVQIDTGGFLKNAEDVAAVVVGVFDGKPVYLRDVAKIVDGAEEPSQYVLFGQGAATPGRTEGEYPAVTISVAKRKGANAVWVVDDVLKKVELLKGKIIPSDVEIAITRNYGQTAEEKSNELLFHMAIAVVGVTILIGLVLGWRESGVVAVAIPVTLALTLATFYFLGFTLNRITLFALIFSIGILVDDPIVDVENIVRHFRLPENKGRPLLEVTIEAVNEVRSPLILATLTVIAAILPMGFVGGLMGPYMRPIPIGASAAMVFSMVVAFVVTPWAAYRILKGRASKVETKIEHGPARVTKDGLEDWEMKEAAAHVEGEKEDWSTRLYRHVMGPLIHHPWWQAAFLVAMVLLLLGAMSMVYFKLVRVKMLPFDNKSEFEVVIDMDQGATLEETARVAQELAAVVRQEPEVTNYQIYVGTAAPYTFNGLVRHYFLRQGPTVAEIQVNLIGKGGRKAQSHEIAKRVRAKLAPIAAKLHARMKVVEVPPGPPVLETLVAEIYGPDYQKQIEAARKVRAIFEKTPGVVDVDWYMQGGGPKYVFQFDHEKAALNSISAEQVAQALKVALEGSQVGLLHVPQEKEDVAIMVRLPVAQRSSADDLLTLRIASPSGTLVPLGELIKAEPTTEDTSIYEKNMQRVVYVLGDVAGQEESPAYAIFNLNEPIEKLGMEIHNMHQPFSTEKLAMKWDGEWHITLEVFRDLGAAFAVVLVLIYVLVVGWFRSFKTPFIIMAAIPFSLVGILPAHWAMGAFFTATSMIGFIAGAGIVVRNSIILVDFIELRLSQGMPLAEAVIDAGAVRFRPMMLTAAAVIVGASVILFDPIFQGLAISLMAGEVASLLLSRMAVPVIYYLAMRKQPER